MDYESSSDSSFVDDEVVIGDVVDKKDYRIKLLSLKPLVSSKMKRNTFGGFTAPKEEIAPPEENQQNSFIDKVAEILNETSSANASNCETEKLNLQESMTDSLESQDERLLSFKSEVANIITDENKEVIVISDSETDDDFLRYQGTQLKYEDISIDNISQELDEVKYEDYVCDSKPVHEMPTINISQEQNDYLYSYGTSGDKFYQDSNSDVQEEFVQRPKEISMNEGAQSNSKHQINNASDNVNISTLDDTLNDMMNYFENFNTSKQGLKTLRLDNQENSSQLKNSPSTKDIISQSISKKVESKLPKPITTPNAKKVLTAKSEFNNIISPVSNYIKSGSKGFQTPVNKNDVFKTPKPVASNSKSNTQEKFKNIPSPIGIYIKHSGSAGIHRTPANCQKTPQKIGHKLPDHLFEENLQPRNLEHFNIPKKIYKAAGLNLEVKDKEISLPKNIIALMPSFSDMVLTKHEGRRLCLDEKDTSAMLENDWDLTNMSLHLGNNDVSILHTKPYI